MSAISQLNILLIRFLCSVLFTLEPNEILVIVNRQLPASEQIAQYYCQKRNIPEQNVLYLALGYKLRDSMSRDEYDKSVAGPIRTEILRRTPGDIRCLVTTYGVPIVVYGRGTLPGMTARLRELQELVAQEKLKLEQLQQQDPNNPNANAAQKNQINQRILPIQSEIDRISGKESHASVDSELSMLLHDSYELHRWQINDLRSDVFGIGFRTLMVSRLDGPNPNIVKGLIDKAISTEQTGLKGTAYVDSRGLKGNNLMGFFDQSLRELADYIRTQTAMPVKEEQTGRLFQPGECPQTAIYCGWYSVKKYVDAFDFVDGAVGFHIASFEATGLHDPNSTAWCTAMLRDGITATLGPVAEPYLHTFPNPKVFFMHLFSGSCLVEAYYRALPFNSWQLLLIGDPLYRPFKKEDSSGPESFGLKP